MNVKRLLFPSFLVCSVLALTLRRFAKPASAKPASNRASYDAIDAYIEQQMRRLKIPGVLLNQTSGMSTLAGTTICLADLDDRPDAAERQARALSTLKLNRPVGASFQYCNLNYNLLGLVIEAASGRSYAEYIQEHILAPLGMSRTYTSQAMAKQNGLAMGHRYWFGFPIAAPNMPFPLSSLPAGGLISSSEDMARYLIAQLNGGCYGKAQVLSSAGIDELHRGVAEQQVMGTSATTHPARFPALDDACVGAGPDSPSRRRSHHAAALAPLAPGPGASPTPWAHLGATCPAAADPEPLAGGRPGLSAFQRPAPFYGPLYARPFLDCPDQRRIRGDLGLPAHRADPRGTARVVISAIRR